MRSPEELTQIFRARGLKITPQRQSIFRVLHGSTVHPTAEAVYHSVRAEMPSISLRTVYQTLNDLAAMGEIQAIDLGTGSIRFDRTPDRTTTSCDSATHAGRRQVRRHRPRRGRVRLVAQISSTGARVRKATAARPESASTTTEDPPSQEAIRA